MFGALFARLRRRLPSQQRSAPPLHFAGSIEAVEFACTITPPHRDGLDVVAVVLGAETALDGSVFAMLDVAAPSGPMRMLASWPGAEWEALAFVGSLCAVRMGPLPPGLTPTFRVAIVVAILDPTYLPSPGQWPIRRRLHI